MSVPAAGYRADDGPFSCHLYSVDWLNRGRALFARSFLVAAPSLGNHIGDGSFASAMALDLVTALLPDATHSKEALKGRLLFLRSFLNDPRQVGSFSPSLHFLGDAMREMIEEVSRGPFTVAVLGVGTGAVAKSFSGLDLYGFDLSAPLLSYAQERLPDAELRRADVLSREFSLSGLPRDKSIAIVSCIPVVNLTARQRGAYEEKIDAFLDSPQVLCFTQYSYLPRPPLRIPRSSRRQRWVLRNLPPAGIHLWRRNSQASGIVAKAA